jgi:predicted dehydrogenase
MGIKVGIIGCGMIAGRFEPLDDPGTYSHAKAYANHGAYGELAFVDHEISKSAFLAEKFSGKAFGTMDEMLELFHPEVVSICTPDDTHFRFTEMALEAKLVPKIIFVEKPVCTRREDLAKLLALESAGEAAVIVNHSRRFDPAHQRLMRFIRGGELGAVVNVHVDYYGGWCHLGVHIVDTLRYLFNAEVQLERLCFKCESKYPNDPTLDVDGRIATAAVRLVGHREEYYQILDMNLMFERGQIKLTNFGKRIEVLRKTVNAERENILETDAESSDVGMTSPMTTAIELIAQCINSGDKQLLTQYGLGEASKTMNTIWCGMGKREN